MGVEIRQQNLFVHGPKFTHFLFNVGENLGEKFKGWKCPPVAKLHGPHSNA